MNNLYRKCLLCPRSCGVNRLAGEKGYCGETSALRAAAAVLHYGEEPPLTGTGGSGTIFISGCNLGCIFCQNYQISQGNDERHLDNIIGKDVSIDDFARICLNVQEKGGGNINIVTGSHAIPAIIDGLLAAKKLELTIPILWNSSAYETTDALELLRDIVDIYLPDLKTLDSGIARRFFNAEDYPVTAQASILKMIEMAGSHSAGKNTLCGRVIIRHLILPGFLESTREVLRWFAENAQNRAMLSLMTQYTPIPNRSKDAPQRFLSEKEYDTIMTWLDEFGIENGFCQELVTGSGWLPDFRKKNPFPSELSVPLWSGR
jgi:putative pyruvate formate lyase activating enzyme